MSRSRATPWRGALGAVGVVVALHLGVRAVRAVGGDADRPSVASPARLVPASIGAVRTLALQFHRPAAERFLPVFGQMLRALDPTTQIEVVVADGEDERIFRAAHAEWFPDGGGPPLRFATAGRAITSWLRDRLAVLDAGTGQPVLLAPAAAQGGPEARTHDWLVPWSLGRRTGARVERARYRFDGGDLIADGDRIYTATPLYGRNPDIDPEHLAGMLAADFGRPVLRLGRTGPVPDHHVGMFVTPLGDGRVAVGDPEAGLAALRATGWDGTGDTATVTVDGRPLVLDLRPERLDRFRRVMVELRDAGCTLVSIPILPAADDFVFLSYNNVLADRRADGLHVLMPTYGVAALDRAATAAWAAAGVHVHPIACAGVVRFGGTVRCLCAPLVRG